MRYRYYICDVFTDTRFSGNQLAVLPEAGGLSTTQMQQIAREFNFSESTFVFAPEAGHTRKVRIFTPSVEVPFAGHPNVGTAFVLASSGGFGDFGSTTKVTFEEHAGSIPITIERGHHGLIRCELAAPEMLSLDKSVSAEQLAEAVSLAADDVITSTHLPQAASVGLPFLFAEIRDRATLARARVNIDALRALAAVEVPVDVHLYTHSNDEFDLRARMFAPFDGVPEDPATGSANCALAGLLAHYDLNISGDFDWRIAQGVEMGRPSSLDACARKRNGEVVSTGVAGTSVMVSEGEIEVD